VDQRHVAPALTDQGLQVGVARRIQKLAAEGLSPYKISADLAERGVKLSHVTVRKIIGRRAAA
jgi:hypothetical protein